MNYQPSSELHRIAEQCERNLERRRAWRIRQARYATKYHVQYVDDFGRIRRTISDTPNPYPNSVILDTWWELLPKAVFDGKNHGG